MQNRFLKKIPFHLVIARHKYQIFEYKAFTFALTDRMNIQDEFGYATANQRLTNKYVELEDFILINLGDQIARSQFAYGR